MFCVSINLSILSRLSSFFFPFGIELFIVFLQSFCKLIVCMSVLVVHLCLTLWHHGLYSPPRSFVHGILQIRILEWVAIPFSRESSQVKNRIQISCIAGGFFTIWPTREAPKLIVVPAFSFPTSVFSSCLFFLSPFS